MTTKKTKRAKLTTTTDTATRADLGATPIDVMRADHPTSPEKNERADVPATPKGKRRAKPRTPAGEDTRAIPDATPIMRTRDQDRYALKRKVKVFYDLQRLRLQTAGRTYERAEGTSIDLHEVDIAILESRAKELERTEKSALKDVQEHLESMPFYQKVLSDKVRYRGIGPTMAGVILSEFDIHREDTASKMWAFAGLAPVPAKRCTACHMVMDDDGKHPTKSKCQHKGAMGPSYDSGKAKRPQKGEKLTYNSFLKTKLVGVLADVMIKLNSPWRKFYDDYKHRKQSAGWGISDGHRNNASKRYMIKMLLLDIHREWRTHEGLSVRPSYQEQYLGHGHIGGDAHQPYASHASGDAHHQHASRPNDDTQDIHASRSGDDTHPPDASRPTSDTQKANAGRETNDTHLTGAGHRMRDDQNRHASQSEADAQGNHADRDETRMSEIEAEIALAE